jgi:hypothetical protein
MGLATYRNDLSESRDIRIVDLVRLSRLGGIMRIV